MTCKSFEGPRSFSWENYCSRVSPVFLTTNVSPFAVILGNSTGVDDEKQSKIEAGLAGVEIAKNLSSEIRKAVEIGVLNLTINGTVFVPDEQSLNFTEPVVLCAKGQSLRDRVCGNLYIFITNMHVK